MQSYFKSRQCVFWSSRYNYVTFNYHSGNIRCRSSLFGNTSSHVKAVKTHSNGKSWRGRASCPSATDAWLDYDGVQEAIVLSTVSLSKLKLHLYDLMLLSRWALRTCLAHWDVYVVRKAHWHCTFDTSEFKVYFVYFK